MLGVISAGLGFLPLFLGPLAGTITALASAVLRFACVLSIIGAAIAGLGLGSGIATWATNAVRPVANLVAKAIDGFIRGLGNPTDLLNLIVGIGCSTRKCE